MPADASAHSGLLPGVTVPETVLPARVASMHTLSLRQVAYAALTTRHYHAAFADATPGRRARRRKRGFHTAIAIKALYAAEGHDFHLFSAWI